MSIVCYEYQKLEEYAIKTVSYKNYTVTKLDHNSINVTKDGILMDITKPILRELAQEFRISLVNDTGREYNTRQLGVLVIRAIEEYNAGDSITFNDGEKISNITKSKKIIPLNNELIANDKIHISKLIKEYQQTYENSIFMLLKDEKISDVLNKDNVPNLYGVYIIYGVINNAKELIYIGKSGTMQTNGHFRSQGISGRLKAVGANNIPRNIYFQDVINEHYFDALSFTWIVTVNEDKIEIPALAEAQLLQAYFNDNNRLPMLNKEF